MLHCRQINHYLAHIRAIKGAHELIDVHVHPFEVIFNDVHYQRNPDSDGVFSLRKAPYRSPEITEQSLEVQSMDSCQDIMSREARRKCLMLSLRQRYQHTGPQVFVDQMALSGIDRVVLLPVAPPGVEEHDPMPMLTEMFGHDRRFILGYAVQPSIEPSRIGLEIARAVANHKIKTIKLHPAISGINLRTRAGQEHIEAILDALRRHCLSLVVHGGKSPDALNRDSLDDCTLDRLSDINWSMAECPVVIAHAGVYGYERKAAKSELSKLGNLLSSHKNVMLDLSGLPFGTLCDVLELFGSERIVFGSDSLYFSQWQSIARLYHALVTTCSDADDKFLNICCINPASIIGEENRNARVDPVAAMSN